MGKAIYIDFSAGSGGSGTFALPYGGTEGLAVINNYQGQGNAKGQVFAIKANGAKLRGAISLDTATNYRITSYGSGARAILDGSKVVAPTFTLNTGTTYTFPSTFNRQMFADGVQLLQTATLADCQATIGTQFWTANTLYVNVGANPATIALWESVHSAANGGINNVFFAASGDGAIIQDVVFQKSADSVFAVGAWGRGLLVENVDAKYAGDNTLNGARDAFVIYGSQQTGGSLGLLATAATEVCLRHCTAWYSSHNSFEFWGTDHLEVDQCASNYCDGIELWGYNTYSKITRTKIYNAGYGQWVAKGIIGPSSVPKTETGILLVKEDNTVAAFRQVGITNTTIEDCEFTSDTGNGVEFRGGTGTIFRRNKVVSKLGFYNGGSLGGAGATNKSALYAWTAAGASASVHTEIADLSNNIFWMQGYDENTTICYLSTYGSPTAIGQNRAIITAGDNNYWYSAPNTGNANKPVNGFGLMHAATAAGVDYIPNMAGASNANTPITAPSGSYWADVAQIYFDTNM
ncbi:MAG TPA: hypothetical protein VLC91_16815, partial [Spongiibacteraceae bacterium]|nr:hypothetical protein [Spongiibacteraceae bacterium]